MNTFIVFQEKQVLKGMNVRNILVEVFVKVVDEKNPNVTVLVY